MNVSDYNLKRHIELLNREKEIRSENTHENEKEFWELNKYDIFLSQHILWESRFEIAWLLQTFLNKEITALKFHDRVFALRRNHLEKIKKFRSKLASGEIKEFFPDKEAYKLKGFLTALYCECEHFEMHWDEKDFYDSIQNGFLNLQEILNF